MPVTVCCLLLLLLLSGCGRKGPEVVPVEGTITLDGGPWPKPGTLYFTAETSSSGLTSRPAMGAFDTDGNLTVTTFKKGDGLIPGKHKIRVECWETPPRMGSTTPPKSYLPNRYCSTSTSGLAVTVEPNQAVVRLKLNVAKK